MQVDRTGNLLAQYRAGDCATVWREIRAHQRIGGAFRLEVLEVAQETMKRVARNADRLAARLQAEGWTALSGRLRSQPSSDDDQIFERIEAITKGPLPPTLSAFWAEVGGIDLVWNYKAKENPPDLGVDVPMVEMDPLCVEPAQFAKVLFEDWELQKEEAEAVRSEPFDLALSTDELHKIDVSGGPPYGIELPFFGADPIFANEPHELPFVEYLRLCFRWAGFPGLESYGDREDVRALICRFGQDLEPF